MGQASPDCLAPSETKRISMASRGDLPLAITIYPQQTRGDLRCAFDGGDWEARLQASASSKPLEIENHFDRLGWFARCDSAASALRLSISRLHVNFRIQIIVNEYQILLMLVRFQNFQILNFEFYSS